MAYQRAGPGIITPDLNLFSFSIMPQGGLPGISNILSSLFATKVRSAKYPKNISFTY